jgi:hypothetical protein
MTLYARIRSSKSHYSLLIDMTRSPTFEQMRELATKTWMQKRQPARSHIGQQHSTMLGHTGSVKTNDSVSSGE